MFAEQRGQALIIVLLLTTVILMIGGAAVTLGVSVKKNAAMEVAQQKAYYIAEAGVQKALAIALAKAKSDPGWVDSLSTVTETNLVPDLIPSTYADGIIEYVKVKKDAKGNLLITSRGIYQRSSRTLTVKVALPEDAARQIFRGVWVNGLAGLPQGRGGLDLTGDLYISKGVEATIPDGSRITGNVYCLGKIELNGRNNNETVVRGNIYALGEDSDKSVVLGSYARVEGKIYVDNAGKVEVNSNASHGGIEVISTDWLRSQIPKETDFPELLSDERLNWYRDNADVIVNSSELNDYNFGQNMIYFRYGDLNISGTYSGRAILVVNGDVEIGKTGRDKFLERSSENDCLTILCTGNIEAKSQSNEDASIQALLYCKGSFKAYNKTNIQGSIVAGTFNVSGNEITITYDNDMLDLVESEDLNWTGRGFRILEWKEKTPVF